jgi:hypothetical protein
MSFTREKVEASKFEIIGGAYHFYEMKDPHRNTYEVGEEIYRVKCTYPVAITIIEKIER